MRTDEDEYRSPCTARIVDKEQIAIIFLKRITSIGVDSSALSCSLCLNTDIVFKEKTGLIFFCAEGICADRSTFDIRKILNKSNNAKVVINENIGGVDGSAWPFLVDVIP